MNGSGEGRNGVPRAEDGLELRRHLEGLRRGAWIIAVITVAVTAAVLVLSLALPERYRATARIVLEEPSQALTATDAESIRRELATTEALLTSPSVLGRAARRVPGESRDTVEDKVDSSVDQEANIINVSATDHDRGRAAAVANAVATVFLSERRDLERRRLAAARKQLLGELERLRGSPSAEVQIGAIRERLSEVGLREASAGSDLQIAEKAEPPSEPTSPRPVRNSVLTLFASLFLGVLVALGRNQLVPRPSSPRELSRLTNIPVIAGIPYVRRRARRPFASAEEEEAYQMLAASLHFTFPQGEQRIVLVTSALHAEGKTTVTAGLGRALAEAGHRALLVSADLRRPTLHRVFGVDLSSGLAEMLAAIDKDPNEFGESEVPHSIRALALPGHRVKGQGSLGLITSGHRRADPTRLLASQNLKTFFDAVREQDYDYVLVDAPPLLGLADGQLLAREANDILLVGRLDRLTLDNVADLREILNRLELEATGIVAVGARREVPPYYLGKRARASDEPQEASG